MLDIQQIKYNADGLVPVIVQDDTTGQVLMLAYMNAQSLAITLQEKRTCFWSRSRQELWRKGATSGNVQEVVSVTADCDNDTLLVRVNKQGPACHTGETSCFHNPVLGQPPAEAFMLQQLYTLLEGRKANPQEGSYTSYLFEKGLDKILKKIGEECTEVIIGAAKQDKNETVYEIADLCYHVMVLMAETGITPQDITSELASRHVVDKKVKQEKMQ